MNHVSLIGRIVKEVTLHQADAHSRVVCNNTLAVSSVYKNHDGVPYTDFISIVAFGKVAERLQRFVKKGDRVGIDGRLHARWYKNREQQEIFVLEVIVEEIFFLEQRNECDEVAELFTASKQNKGAFAPQ